MSETKESIKCSGYSLFNRHKETIRFEDGKYKNFVDADFFFHKKTSTKCYDKQGNYLGWFDKETTFTKREEREIYKQLSVVQINYKFYLLPVGYVNTIDEVSNCEKILINSFNVKPPRIYSSVINDISNLTREFHEIKQPNSEEIFIPLEICIKGHSRHVENRTNKKMFDLDIKQYTKDKDEFIKENPDFKDRVEFLYSINLGILISFWGVTKKQLFQNKFDRTKAAIDKLNRRITNETKKR